MNVWVRPPYFLQLATRKLTACRFPQTEHRNPEGRTYWFNTGTQQSVWEKPDGAYPSPLLGVHRS